MSNNFPHVLLEKSSSVLTRNAVSRNIVLHSWRGAPFSRSAGLSAAKEIPKLSTIIMLARALNMGPGILVNEAQKGDVCPTRAVIARQCHGSAHA
jgi:hypothetical protein